MTGVECITETYGSNRFRVSIIICDVQSQTAVTAHFLSKQLLMSAFTLNNHEYVLLR